MIINPSGMKTYRRDALLGAFGALLMLVGDLCLSVIPPGQSDSGLFMREAYLNGSWEHWRLSVLTASGFCGMVLEFFAFRVFYFQILPQYRKTRASIIAAGVIVMATASALHLFIGTLADWTTTLSPLLGREETILLIQTKFDRLMPSMYISYVGLAVLFLVSGFAVLTGRTILPRWMTSLHMIVFQLIFVLIPDIRQALGASISTWDYILSQGSTNASLFIWMIVNALWADRKAKEQGVKGVCDERQLT